MIYLHGQGVQQYNSMSIDRLIPNLGYIKNNIVLCMYIANTSKGSKTEVEFYDFCTKILQWKQNHQTPIEKTNEK